MLSFTGLLEMMVSLWTGNLGRTLQREDSGGPVVKNLPASSGDTSSIPGPGRSHMQQSNEVCVLQLLKPMHSRVHAP